MTQDQIISMAKKAGFEVDKNHDVWITDGYWLGELERFAELVAAAEREACAALCFQIWNKWMDEKDTTPFPDAEDCAAQIRARGQV